MLTPRAALALWLAGSVDAHTIGDVLLTEENSEDKAKVASSEENKIGIKHKFSVQFEATNIDGGGDAVAGSKKASDDHGQKSEEKARTSDGQSSVDDGKAGTKSSAAAKGEEKSRTSSSSGEVAEGRLSSTLDDGNKQAGTKSSASAESSKSSPSSSSAAEKPSSSSSTSKVVASEAIRKHLAAHDNKLQGATRDDIAAAVHKRSAHKKRSSEAKKHEQMDDVSKPTSGYESSTADDQQKAASTENGVKQDTAGAKAEKSGEPTVVNPANVISLNLEGSGSVAEKKEQGEKARKADEMKLESEKIEAEQKVESGAQMKAERKAGRARMEAAGLKVAQEREAEELSGLSEEDLKLEMDDEDEDEDEFSKEQDEEDEEDDIDAENLEITPAEAELLEQKEEANRIAREAAEKKAGGSGGKKSKSSKKSKASSTNKEKGDEDATRHSVGEKTDDDTGKPVKKHVATDDAADGEPESGDNKAVTEDARAATKRKSKKPKGQYRVAVHDDEDEEGENAPKEVNLQERLREGLTGLSNEERIKMMKGREHAMLQEMADPAHDEETAQERKLRRAREHYAIGSAKFGLHTDLDENDHEVLRVKAETHIENKERRTKHVQDVMKLSPEEREKKARTGVLVRLPELSTQQGLILDDHHAYTRDEHDMLWEQYRDEVHAHQQKEHEHREKQFLETGKEIRHEHGVTYLVQKYMDGKERWKKAQERLHQKRYAKPKKESWAERYAKRKAAEAAERKAKGLPEEEDEEEEVDVSLSAADHQKKSSSSSSSSSGGSEKEKDKKTTAEEENDELDALDDGGDQDDDLDDLDEDNDNIKNNAKKKDTGGRPKGSLKKKDKASTSSNKDVATSSASTSPHQNKKKASTPRKDEEEDDDLDELDADDEEDRRLAQEKMEEKKKEVQAVKRDAKLQGTRLTKEERKALDARERELEAEGEEINRDLINMQESNENDDLKAGRGKERHKDSQRGKKKADVGAVSLATVEDHDEQFSGNVEVPTVGTIRRSKRGLKGLRSRPPVFVQTGASDHRNDVRDHDLLVTEVGENVDATAEETSSTESDDDGRTSAEEQSSSGSSETSSTKTIDGEIRKTVRAMRRGAARSGATTEALASSLTSEGGLSRVVAPSFTDDASSVENEDHMTHLQFRVAPRGEELRRGPTTTPTSSSNEQKEATVSSSLIKEEQSSEKKAEVEHHRIENKEDQHQGTLHLHGHFYGPEGGHEIRHAFRPSGQGVGGPDISLINKAMSTTSGEKSEASAEDTSASSSSSEASNSEKILAAGQQTPQGSPGAAVVMTSNWYPGDQAAKGSVFCQGVLTKNSFQQTVWVNRTEELCVGAMRYNNGPRACEYDPVSSICRPILDACYASQATYACEAWAHCQKNAIGGCTPVLEPGLIQKMEETAVAYSQVGTALGDTLDAIREAMASSQGVGAQVPR
ncbi:unnamed protein product [Amoebophrya sp. A25]|nr:unnamed protein product [Amoebophrya sp. A25]|eukprot:GSA25T00008952001.1